MSQNQPEPELRSVEIYETGGEVVLHELGDPDRWIKTEAQNARNVEQ
jgi:hypothetical protein